MTVPRGDLEHRALALPGRGVGDMAFLDFGPPERARDRAVDLIFLHANGFNALTYRTLLGPVAERYRVLAVDQRGHGASSLATDDGHRGDWHDLRDDLIAFLRALDLNGVVLAGHSMGGTVALMAAAEMASARPAVCRGMVLLDPVLIDPRVRRNAATSPMVAAARRRRAVFPSRAAAQDSYRGRGAFRSWPEAVLSDYVAAGFRDLPDGEVTLACAPSWEASSYAAQGHDPWEALANAPCPITLIKAEIGSTCEAVETTSPRRPGLEVITAPDATHFLPMEQPDLVRRALLSALEGLGARTG